MSSYTIEVELQGTDNLSPALLRSTAALDQLESNALRAESSLDMGAAAQGLQTTINSVDDLSSALNGLESAAGIGQIDGQLGEIGTAARSSVDDVAGLASGLDKLGDESGQTRSDVDQLGTGVSRLKRNIMDGQDDLTRMARNMDRVGDEARESSREVAQFGDAANIGGKGFDVLKGALIGGAGLFAAGQIKQIAEETYAAGQEANIAEAKFRAMIDGIGEFEPMMAQLREATGYVVSDTDLMAQSATLLQLNIATNNDQLARMLGLATQLGDVDAFISVMKNGAASKDLLDSIGVSGSRVTQLLEEMGQPASNQEAYGVAVVTAMEEAVNRLGEATEANQTAVGRWGTRVQNVVEGVQKGFSDWANDLGARLETLAGMNPEQQNKHMKEQAAINDALNYARRYSTVLAMEMAKDLKDSNIELPVKFKTVAAMLAFTTSIETDQLLKMPVDIGKALNAAAEAGGGVIEDWSAFARVLTDSYGELTAQAPGAAAGIDAVTLAMDAQAEAIGRYSTASEVYGSIAWSSKFSGVEIQQIEGDAVIGLVQRRGLALKQAGEDALQYQQMLEQLLNEGLSYYDGVTMKDTLEIEFVLNKEAIIEDISVAMEEAKALGYEANINDVTTTVLGNYGLTPQDVPVAFGALVSGYTQVTAHARGAAVEVDAVTLSLQQQDQAMQEVERMASISQLQDREGNGLADPMMRGIREGKRLIDDFFATASNASSQYNAAVGGQIVAMFEEVQAMGEAGFISDVDVATAQEIRDKFAEIQQMGLGGLLGQGGGGALGELYDKVIGALPEELQGQVQDIFDLADGRATDLSNAIDDYVVPFIAELARLDPDMAADAGGRITQILQQAMLLGLPQDQTQGFIQQYMGQYVPVGGGQSFTVKSGDTASGLAAQYGVSVQQILTAAGATDAQHLMPGTYSFGTGAYTMMPDWAGAMNPNPQDGAGMTLDDMMAKAAEDMLTMETSSSRINDEMTSWIENAAAFLDTAHDMVINITAKGEPWLIDALKNGGVTVNGPAGGGGSGNGTGGKPQRGGKNPMAIAMTE